MGEVQASRPVSPEQVGKDAIDAYQRDGVICLRGAVSDDWLAVIEQGVDYFLGAGVDDGDPANVVVKLDGDTGGVHYGTALWQSNPYLRQIIFETTLPDLFGSVLETRSLNFYYDFLIIKDAGCRSAVTPWHHDQSYYVMRGRKIINCWIALDSIPKETALRFARASHKRDDLARAIHFDPNQDYPGLLTERPLPPDFDNDPDADIITCAMEPGDALVFNCRTFHTAPGNHLDRRRGALSLNFIGDDVTYFDMAQLPDPPIRGEGLVDGGSITCESFPLLREW